MSNHKTTKSAAFGHFMKGVAIDGHPWPPVEAISIHFGLSRRRAEVLYLLAGRRTNKEIAAIMGVSVRTAEHHVHWVLRHFNRHRRQVDALLADAFRTN